MYTLSERLRIGWRWVLSFTKRTWAFEDYPITVRPNAAGDPAIAWCAQFLNWPGPAGLGATPQQALDALRGSYREAVRERQRMGEAMPRPGAREPIRFATSGRVDADPALRDEFIERIFGWGPGQPVFISDQSSLRDFGDETEVERLRGLIRSNYGIETADLTKALLADILERISQDRAAKHERPQERPS